MGTTTLLYVRARQLTVSSDDMLILNPEPLPLMGLPKREREKEVIFKSFQETVVS